MASSSYRLRTAHDATPPGRRAGGMALALGFNLLLVLALLTLGVIPPLAEAPSGIKTIDLLPDAPDTPDARDSATSEPAPAAKPAEPDEVPPPVPPQPRPAQQPPPLASPIPPLKPLPWIEMTREEMAAAEVRNLPKADTGSASADDSQEVGRAPNGEVLYAAEWARRPTRAEASGYLPRNAPDGFGLIACRTAPENRVEDCVEIGSDPPGSQLARAVRLAAWQFRVRPPRKNGRPLIGEWVRIKIEYYTVGRD